MSKLHRDISDSRSPAGKVWGLCFWRRGAFLFTFSDGKKEWALSFNEVYWEVPEFAEWKPEK